MGVERKCVSLLLLFSILFASEWAHLVESVTTEQDLTLTLKEKQALDEFKKRAIPIVPHDYMKQDIYLIRWLRARDLNLEQAETMLRENLKWREDNKMDTILEEDFSEMERDFPYQSHFHDKEGKPIMTANFGDWNIRKVALAGKLPLLYRHFDRAIENITRRVRQLQDEGKPVTQFDFIINMDQYEVTNQGCLQCMPYYTHVISTYENRYPMTADKIMLINTPTVFEVILNLIRPLMSPRTRDALQVYNSNKQSWQSELLKIVDKDELPIEYGGTREI